MTKRMTFRITAALMAAMVFASGTLATAAICQSLCAPAAQPTRTMHHGGMNHMHTHAASDAVMGAGMSGPQCSTQVDARLDRRAVNTAPTRQTSVVAPAVTTVSHFTSTAPGDPGAVASRPPNLTISSSAIPLRI